MRDDLASKIWENAKEEIRKCHLSLLQEVADDVSTWKDAFDTLVNALIDERNTTPSFARELSLLTEETGFTYDFKDILEEYFDFLEEREQWLILIESCDKIIEIFEWKESIPSQYLFRKGNALQKLGRMKEAEAFGKEWLEKYPDDLYAGASNAFLLVELGRKEEALELTKKYMSEELVCENAEDTVFMAAVRLFEMTDDSFAKERVAKKIAEYEALK